MSAKGPVVADRVRTLIVGAMRGDPSHWWDSEELADVVDERSPHLTEDPGAQVKTILRQLREEEPVGFVWDKQPRRSARARFFGSKAGGCAVFVYRWEEARDA